MKSIVTLVFSLILSFFITGCLTSQDNYVENGSIGTGSYFAVIEFPINPLSTDQTVHAVITDCISQSGATLSLSVCLNDPSVQDQNGVLVSSEVMYLCANSTVLSNTSCQSPVPQKVYSTLDPLKSSSSVTFSADYLSIQNSRSGNWDTALATQALSGKQYFEVAMPIDGNTSNAIVGISGYNPADPASLASHYPGQASEQFGLGYGLNYATANTMVAYAVISSDMYVNISGSIYTIGVAVDASTGDVWFQIGPGVWMNGKNPANSEPVAQYDPSNVAYPAIGVFAGTIQPFTTVNFGASSFTFPVPDGFSPGVYQNNGAPNNN